MLVALVFLYVPLMGAMAPIFVATYHHLRLLDHIVPLFLIFGVVGLFYMQSEPNPKIIKWLIILSGLLIIFGIICLIADKSIVNRLGPHLLQDLNRTLGSEFEKITLYVRETGKNSLFISGIILVGLSLCLAKIQRIMVKPKVVMAISLAVIGYAAVTLLANARIYANDVKNINEVDKAAGLYLRDNSVKGQIVGVNDIGAIGYFSGLKVLDLKGLISPEITSAMILNDSLAFDYMQHYQKVDFLAIFPAWFNYIPKKTDIFKPIKSIATEWNTILAGDTTIIYQAVWPDTISFRSGQ